MARGAEAAEKRCNERQPARESDDARGYSDLASNDAAGGHGLQDRGEIVETCHLDRESFIFEKVDLTDEGRYQRNGQ
jgi:hypothetical protein